MTLAALLSLTLAAAPTPSERAIIEGLQAELATAFAAGDLARWDALLSPGFTFSFKGRVGGRAQFLGFVKAEMDGFAGPVQARYAARALERDGSDLISIVNEQTCHPMKDLTGAVRSLCWRHDFKIRWRREAQGWRAAAFTFPGAIAYTIDGAAADQTAFDRVFVRAD